MFRGFYIAKVQEFDRIRRKKSGSCGCSTFGYIFIRLRPFGFLKWNLPAVRPTGSMKRPQTAARKDQPAVAILYDLHSVVQSLIFKQDLPIFLQSVSGCF